MSQCTSQSQGTQVLNKTTASSQGPSSIKPGILNPTTDGANYTSGGKFMTPFNNSITQALTSNITCKKYIWHHDNKAHYVVLMMTGSVNKIIKQNLALKFLPRNKRIFSCSEYFSSPAWSGGVLNIEM